MAAMFFDGSKFCKQFLKRVISNSDRQFQRRRFFKKFLHVHIAQKVSPPHGGHVFRRINILRTIFEKGHPRNILVKLFLNRTRGFREEDFLKISSCPYSTKRLTPMAAMFFDGSKFHKQFSKSVNQETILRIFLKI